MPVPAHHCSYLLLESAGLYSITIALSLGIYTCCSWTYRRLLECYDLYDRMHYHEWQDCPIMHVAMTSIMDNIHASI